jgi:hypothetical protein
MDYRCRVGRSSYSAEDMPEYPARVLGVHCAIAGSQLGSVIGTFVATPVCAFRRKVPPVSAWRKYSFTGTLFGVSLSMALLHGYYFCFLYCWTVSFPFCRVQHTGSSLLSFVLYHHLLL